MNSDAARYIPTLDGWRAVAILAVMAYHAHFELIGPRGYAPNAALTAVVDKWGVGVDVFFAISGYLICTRLLAERAKTGRIDLRGFYLRRTFRILPPYFAYLAVVGLLGAAGMLAVKRGEFLSCLVFLRNYVPKPLDGLYTRHFWSLAVEEHFYLIWPALLVLAATVPRARRLAFGLGMGIAVWRGIDSHWQIAARVFGQSFPGNVFRTDTRLDGLVFGCWAALLVADPGWRGRLDRWLSPAAWWGLVAVMLVVLYGPGMPMARLWVALLLPLVLVGTVLHPGTLVGRSLEWGPLRWIGRISYSLYLWQQLFLVPRPGPLPLGLLQVFPLNVLAVFGCALASYHLVERPVMAMRGRWFPARQAVAHFAAGQGEPLPRCGVAAP
jgi:peptidoglycan/LPS O-acetylase OafA/YrhL